jgi:hypothetical protein
VNLPQYIGSARKGEHGVSIVSQIANDRFGWIFRRNHQEHDFGIDGHIEVVTASGSVTGQMLALQIKCGKSYFERRNALGYVYSGSAKHFNYFANCPVPVLIVLCDPNTDDCRWALFDPKQTRRKGKGWELTIPFMSQLANDREALENLLPSLHDSFSEKEYWRLNAMIADADYLHYVIGKDEVEKSDTSHARDFFERLKANRELAFACQGKIEMPISGYDDDERELFEIPGEGIHSAAF